MEAIIDQGKFSSLVKANRNNRHAAVIRAAAELFANSPTPSNGDIVHFEELCLRLLPKLSLSDRSELSEKLSACRHTPRSVALKISEDDFAVAGPMLENFLGFNDDDLLIILARCGEPHALAIASRPTLSDKLICGLSGYHLTQVLPNVGPEHSVQESDHVLYLKENDQTGSDYTVKEQPKEEFDMSDLSYDLQWMLEAEHAHILTHLNDIEKTIQKSKIDPKAVLSSAFDRALGARDFNSLLQKSNEQGFADLLAERCDLPRADTIQIIDDEKGFALFLCLKSLSLPKHIANEASILLNETLGKDMEQVYLLDWFYDQISPAAARHVVDHWKAESQTDETQATNHAPVFSARSHAEARPSREYTSNDKAAVTDQKRTTVSR